VRGVGNKVTKVVCKLTNVPVSVGADQAKGSCFNTTFYVLDCPTYHCILGLTLLQKINAGVFCSTRRLQYKLGRAGEHKQHSIPLMPRSWVKTTPAYLTVHATPPANVSELEMLTAGGWEAALADAE
jgi:hypothetical protein